MVELMSFLIVIVLSVLSGQTFRKQYKQNTLTKCLMMLLSMTMSIVVGIIVATWIPNMVISTILAIVVSAIFAFAMTYKLPIAILLESFGALLMGGMMGAMLSIMTTSYATLSCVFFMLLYIATMIVSIGLWNREDFPQFQKAIPPAVYSASVVAIVLLMAVSAIDFVEQEPMSEVEHEHHHHK